MKNILNTLFALIIGIFVGVASCGSYFSHNYHVSTRNPEPQIEYIYVEHEPEVITEVEYVYAEPEVITQYVPRDEFFRNISAEDEWYLKDLAMREAEGEGVIGQCWVMYTVLCRCEAYGHSIKQEWSSEAYTSMNRSGITPNEDCLKAYELIHEGWIPKPLFFRASHYHTFGTKLCQVGNHYYSY